ncbi:MAG: universal stress protein [Chthoniobacter sp.]|nr:universal stress protein [Chthoniobacter sp.]
MNTKPRIKIRRRGAKRGSGAPFHILQEPPDNIIDLVPRRLNIRHILVPLDFSEPAEKALHYAVSFAQQSGAGITLLHVCPVPYYPAEFGGFPTTLPADEPATDKLQAHLEATAKRLVPTPICERALLRTGAAADEICQVAREYHIDLIVIATKGRTALKRLLLGSTAERVVRHAPCPVLVVRENEREFL